MEMAQASKRRKRRKKKNKTDEKNDETKESRESECTFQPTLETLHVETPTSTQCVMTHSQTTSTNTCVDDSSRNGSGQFQLFVQVEQSGIDENEKSTCLSKLSRCEKLKAKRRQALRGGSTHYMYWDRRMSRRLSCHGASKHCWDKRKKRMLKHDQNLFEVEHHPSTKLSNSCVSITLMGTPVSNSVGKQGTVYEERLKGKLSPPPTVDDANVEVVQSGEERKADREASVRNERQLRRRRRRMARHSRKGRRITQVCSTLDDVECCITSLCVPNHMRCMCDFLCTHVQWIRSGSGWRVRVGHLSTLCPLFRGVSAAEAMFILGTTIVKC